MNWIMLHPEMTPEHLGFLPDFLSDADPRSAAEQINANYAHGGGWHPFSTEWKLDERKWLHYPEDPPLEPLAMSVLRDETIVFYDSAMLMILQKDGSFEVSRVD